MAQLDFKIHALVYRKDVSVKRILIVGGRGFMGTHLAKEMLAKGMEVHTFSRRALGANHARNQAGLFHHQGDAVHASKLLGTISPLHAILYLAHVGWPGFEGSEEEIAEKCLLPLAGFLQSATNQKPGKFIYVSSGGAIYGNQPYYACGEGVSLRPVSVYGKIKERAERMVLDFCRDHGLVSCCVRPGNAYGPGQISSTGAGFIAAAVNAIQLGKEVVVYGFPGTIRDYVHIKDLVRGIRLLMEAGEAGEAYNLGTGKGTDNREILETLRPLAKSEGFSVRVRQEPARSCDVRSVVLESSKAFRTCGWRAEISLREGIPEMWRSARVHAGTSG